MPDHPSGTVTFLFTDVEGSTQLWEHHHAWMTPAHARHEAILRAAIAAHGGWAYKQIGDAFQAAFQTAPQALAAAVAAQRELSAVSRERSAYEGSGIGDRGSEDDNSKLNTQHSKLALRVRMALHTGTTEERADDYLGPLLNRVARLMSAGHGSQILLTATTYELLRDSLPAGVDLRDLGERRLKDLIRPEHVWQVVIEGLPADFPPLKTLDSRPNNLPRQTTALIGREAETAAVVALLRQPDVALVTLTGPGGTGKTRLALQAAADVLEECADGVWFVELAALTDPALVVPAVGQTLGVKEQGTTPLRDTLSTYLADKQLLLVLDNFEQVVTAAVEVAAVLRAAPRVKVLVTSRMPLRVYGEHDYAVPPLSLPDPQHLPPLEQLTQYEAVRLFIERAVAARADFAVTNATAPAVAEICVRLDGLPLAIELAAARSRLFSPEALLARLDQRLKLLTGGSRDQAARQQTLRGAIEWSYNLLEPGEQQLFRRMAVFQGGRTLEALEAVGNVDGSLAVDVLAGAEALLSHSLLLQRTGRDGEPRFWMLETIHEYARERLAASGEAEALGRAHAEYFLRLVEEAAPALRGAHQPMWLARLEDEHDNIRAALAWAREPGTRDTAAAALGLRMASALWRFWGVHGHWREGRALLAGALATPGGDPVVRAQALRGAGALAHSQGDLGAARALIEESLALYRELVDREGIAGTLGILGHIPLAQGDYGAARTLYEESLALYRKLGDQQGLVMSLNNLGGIAYAQGDYAAARALFEESLGLSRERGSQSAIALSLNSLGEVAYAQGDYPAARALFEDSLGLRQKVGDQAGRATTLSNLSNVAGAGGDVAAARALLAESLALSRELGEPVGIATCLAGLSRLLAGQPNGHDKATLARIARILGAVARLLSHDSAVLDPQNQARYEQMITAVRTALSEAKFLAAWAAGQALSLDEACALALAPQV